MCSTLLFNYLAVPYGYVKKDNNSHNIYHYCSLSDFSLNHLPHMNLVHCSSCNYCTESYQPRSEQSFFSLSSSTLSSPLPDLVMSHLPSPRVTPPSRHKKSRSLASLRRGSAPATSSGGQGEGFGLRLARCRHRKIKGKRSSEQVQQQQQCPATSPSSTNEYNNHLETTTTSENQNAQRVWEVRTKFPVTSENFLARRIYRLSWDDTEINETISESDEDKRPCCCLREYDTKKSAWIRIGAQLRTLADNFDFNFKKSEKNFLLT
ncbi:hypothetical protein Anas_02908, partial [Armadillidium nasatum]